VTSTLVSPVQYDRMVFGDEEPGAIRPRPSDDPVMNTRATPLPPVIPRPIRVSSRVALLRPAWFPSLSARDAENRSAAVA
jgi:hypothetical protein